MLSRLITKTLKICWLPAAVLWFAPAVAQAQHRDDDCYHCQRFHCPPHLKHCVEGPPHICFQRGCPRPICNPCMNPNWGYYETCWNPWPWPPDFSHCRAVPPAATVVLNPGPGSPVGLGMPQVVPSMEPETMKQPRPLR